MDTITHKRRSENMRRIKSKDSKPEIIVRKLLHGMGYRYRLHGAGLPGHPDIVFSKRRQIIFVHGCFWHCHNCLESHVPKSAVDYWKQKLERNVTRQNENERKLIASGWRILVLWECELRDTGRLRRIIKVFLGGTKGTNSGRSDNR